MLRALAWKEWREQRPVLGAALSLAILLPLFLLLKEWLSHDRALDLGCAVDELRGDPEGVRAHIVVVDLGVALGLEPALDRPGRADGLIPIAQQRPALLASAVLIDSVGIERAPRILGGVEVQL